MDAAGASRTSLVVMLAVAAFAVPATPPASFAETPDPSDPCTLTGTAGPDVIVGTAGDDVICGGGGDDDITGLGGDDRIRGGLGGDTIDGGEGNDYLNGAEGDDTIEGDAGLDNIRGGSGTDTLTGGGDNDTILSRDAGTVDGVVCGAGSDKAYADLADNVDADCEFERVPDLTPATAVDDDATVAEDDPATIIKVRMNDTDPDGGVNLIDPSLVTQPANGTVVVGPAQRVLTYQPGADYCFDGVTTDDFDYGLTPGGSTATVRVTVTCVPDPAVANDDTATIPEDNGATPIDVLANDVEGDTGTMSVLSATDPALGTVVVTGGGTGLTYEPDANACNNPPPTDDFDYTIGPDNVSATVQVTLACVNDGPVADDDSFTAADAAIGNTVLVVNDPTDAAPTEAGPHKLVTGDILDGDLDIDGPGPLTVTAETVDSFDGGSAVIEADGDFVFTPAAGDSCTDHSDSFDYTVNDGSGGTDVGTVTIETTGCVWYVDNSAAADGGGTSNARFDTLAEAETASAANDTIYLYDGDNLTTGYNAGFDLKAGQRLLGELADLVVAGHHLATGTAGKRPTIAASGIDVVTLGAGNTIRGVEIDPLGAGGIFGSAGDIGGTITDVRIVDAGGDGTQPGLELDGTTGGTYNVSDLTVSTSGAIGIRLSNAGTVAFADVGTISVTTSGARALELSGSNLGVSVFDSVTVTGSPFGGVAATSTGGTVTFANLALTTSGAPAAFFLNNAAGVTVPASGTATVTATSGPAVDVVTAPGAVLSFDSVSSTNSLSDGVNLEGLVGGTFSATTGTISGATGIAFDLFGGTGDVSYGGTITNGAGSTADISGRSGGTITFSGAISDSPDDGGGISLGSNTGGTTLFSGSTALNTTFANAVSMISSDDHTLRFTGGLTLATTSGRGFNAENSGTVAVTGASNTISSTGGGRALSVVNTDIGVDDLTFQSISASGGGANGLVLDTTGTAGNLVVTGTGSGTCVFGNTTGCSGGTISGFVGADDAGQVPVGTGIVLRSTTAPSFTRIHILGGVGAENYGIRGTNVDGFTLADSVLDGTIGTSALTAHKDGAIRFGDDQTQTTGLTGTVTMTNVALSGGWFTNLMVDNFGGVLNATLDNVDSLTLAFGNPDGSDGGDDAVQFEGIINADMNVVYQNSQITTAGGDLFQYIADGSGGGDLDFLDNTLTNDDPSIATGGGGVAIVGGARGPVTLDIQDNSFRDSKTNALTIIKSKDLLIAGTNNLVANIDNNDIGVAGTANSGSFDGDGMEISSWGDGNATYNVTNNDVRQYNSSGIEFIAGSGEVGGGQMNLNVSGNVVANPGDNPLITLLQGIRVSSGVANGDTYATCVDFGPNSISGAGGTPGDLRDFRLFAFQSPIRQPGYGGGNTDTAAFADYAELLIGSGAQGTAFSNAPPVGTNPSATFSGGAPATCP